MIKCQRNRRKQRLPLPTEKHDHNRNRRFDKKKSQNYCLELKPLFRTFRTWFRPKNDLGGLQKTTTKKTGKRKSRSAEQADSISPRAFQHEK